MDCLPKDLQNIVHQYTHQLKINDVNTELLILYPQHTTQCSCCIEDKFQFQWAQCACGQNVCNECYHDDYNCLECDEYQQYLEMDDDVEEDLFDNYGFINFSQFY